MSYKEAMRELVARQRYDFHPKNFARFCNFLRRNPIIYKREVLKKNTKRAYMASYLWDVANLRGSVGSGA